MAMWNELLCAVDFSEPSRLAMLEACDVARRNGARLTLINVFEPPAGALAASDIIAPASPRLVEQVTQELERKLEGWRVEAEKLVGAKVAAVVLPGEPATEVVRFAKEGNYDLLVVATHGRHGVKRLLLGSVAERVVREAPCSVLVARPPRGPAPD
jgi:nucleotide-binding universal stress UspA family protein